MQFVFSIRAQVQLPWIACEYDTKAVRDVSNSHRNEYPGKAGINVLSMIQFRLNGRRGGPGRNRTTSEVPTLAHAFAA